jgi:adenosine deaminase
MNRGIVNKQINFSEVLRRIPKAELHVHMVGAIRRSTLAELARKHGIALPRPEHELYRYRGFHDFIDVLRLAARVVVKAEDFARVVYEYAVDAHRSANLRHLELFFNPSYHYPQNVSYKTQLEGLTAGIDAARSDLGVSCLLIPAIDRGLSLDAARQVLDDVLAHRRDEVVGIGIDGPEDQGPPEIFQALFQRAGKAGLKRTAHVCEDYAPVPSGNYAVCRDLLGCDRLDHGYRVLPDPATVTRARDDGVWFTVCPKPSSRERDGSRLHAIGELADAGVNITLATDDPHMFETDLNDCYGRVFSGLGWGIERARQMALGSVEASWLDEGAKATMRFEFAREIDDLVGELGIVDSGSYPTY